MEHEEIPVEGEDDTTIPDELAMLPLRGVVVYPVTFQALSVGQPRSIQLVDDATVKKQVIGLVTALDDENEEPGPEDVHKVGVAANIHRMIKAPDGTIRLLVQGIERVRIEEWIGDEPYLRARVSPLPDVVEESLEVEALMRNAVDLLRRLVSLVSQLPDELLMAALNLDDPRQLVYFIATNIRMEIPDGQAILELDSIREKLLKLTSIMTKELEVLELGRKIRPRNWRSWSWAGRSRPRPSQRWKRCSASISCASNSRPSRRNWAKRMSRRLRSKSTGPR
jgi:ATP-dependent Lon protease